MMNLPLPGRARAFLRTAALLILTAVAAQAVASGLRPSAPSNGQAVEPSEVIKIDRGPWITRTALVLAGLRDEAEKAGARLPGSDVWQEYCRQMDRAWKAWNDRVLPKISGWAEKELGPPASEAPWVYYPFSGPDILYASIFFPRAQTYVLTGLEKAGESIWREDYRDPRIDGFFESLQLQLQNILGLSFFRREDLNRAQERVGIYDIILVFLARSGFEIVDAGAIYIDKRSQVVPIYPGLIRKVDPRLVRGVKIRFRRPHEPEVKTLFYFCADLSDPGLAKNPEYLEWLRARSRPVTFLKAASYLPQYKRFSTIRSFILDRSSAILQDDSGLAFRQFSPSRWKVALFGRYCGPVDKFKDFFQDDLDAASAAASPAALPFRAGYRIRADESCLVLATSKTSAEAPPAPALVDVTLDGAGSPGVIARGGRPEIEISFSAPVDPVTVLMYLRGPGASPPIALDLTWDESLRKATGVPASPLARAGTYRVVLCAGAAGPDGRSVAMPEAWPLRVLGLSAADFEDKTIIVDRENQQVLLCAGDGSVLGTFPCATGSYYPTAGVHRVIDKYLRAKSLFDDSTFTHFCVFEKSPSGVNIGFHSMPVFPDGRPAGPLGLPDSHGCVRLSDDAAGEIYASAPLGTKVIVY